MRSTKCAEVPAHSPPVRVLAEETARFMAHRTKAIEMNQTAKQRPPMAGFHHFSATVTDVAASASWYQRVLGLECIPGEFPHYGNEDGGYAVILTDFDSRILIVLEHHIKNDGQPFDETRRLIGNSA